MHLSRVFKNILNGTSHPTLAWCDQSGNTIEVLSGPNIWTLAFERSKELKNNGAKPGDRISSPPHGKEFVIDLFAAMIGHFVLVPDESYPRGILPTSNSIALRRKGVFIEMKTSGSSGKPKTRYYTRSGVHQQLENHADFFNSVVEAERLSILPWGHAFGLVLDLLLGLFSKSVIYCPLDEKLRGYRKWITTMLDTYAIHHLAVVPRQLELILFNNRLSPCAPKVVFVGGASLNHSLIERSQSWLGAGKLIEGYGLTEAGPGVLLDGRPIGCEVKVQEGILYVRSPSWSLTETLEESADWNSTDDLCLINESGSLTITCRASHQIKSCSGIWLNLSTIESQLARITSARSVTLKPSSKGLKVFLLLDGALSAEKKDWISERLWQSTGLSTELFEIIIDSSTENLLELSRGKDLSQFFENQRLVS